MYIYNVILYAHSDNHFYELRHKLFKNLNDAKKHAKTYLEDNSKRFQNYNFHYCEHDYERDNRVYLLTMDYDGYFNGIVKEKVEIYKEQVY